MGVEDFFGAHMMHGVDTTKPFTVVTQFITNDDTDNGNLDEIRRIYVQDGKVIPNSEVCTHVCVCVCVFVDVCVYEYTCKMGMLFLTLRYARLAR